MKVFWILVKWRGGLKDLFKIFGCGLLVNGGVIYDQGGRNIKFGNYKEFNLVNVRGLVGLGIYEVYFGDMVGVMELYRNMDLEDISVQLRVNVVGVNEII